MTSSSSQGADMPDQAWTRCGARCWWATRTASRGACRGTTGTARSTAGPRLRSCTPPPPASAPTRTASRRNSSSTTSSPRPRASSSTRCAAPCAFLLASMLCSGISPRALRFAFCHWEVFHWRCSPAGTGSRLYGRALQWASSSMERYFAGCCCGAPTGREDGRGMQMRTLL